MNIELPPEEATLLEYAMDTIVKYNRIRHTRGGIDTLYAFVLSDSGMIHDGACFEPTISHATICGERHAIANMILQESYQARIKSILVADPVPEVQERSRPPCGTCRHIIWSQGTPETSVVLVQYIQGLHGWTFPVVERFLIPDLYPYPFEPKEDLWQGFQPR
jgi:cytidine deaminase